MIFFLLCSLIKLRYNNFHLVVHLSRFSAPLCFFQLMISNCSTRDLISTLLLCNKTEKALEYVLLKHSPVLYCFAET